MPLTKTTTGVTHTSGALTDLDPAALSSVACVTLGVTGAGVLASLAPSTLLGLSLVSSATTGALVTSLPNFKDN